MQTIAIDATEFSTADEAIQHTYASGRGKAIRIAGRFLVVDEAEADRLAATGVSFAYLGTCVLRDGCERIVTTPVN